MALNVDFKVFDFRENEKVWGYRYDDVIFEFTKIS